MQVRQTVVARRLLGRSDVPLEAQLAQAFQHLDVAETRGQRAHVGREIEVLLPRVRVLQRTDIPTVDRLHRFHAGRFAAVLMSVTQALDVAGLAGRGHGVRVPRHARDVRHSQTVDVPDIGGNRTHVRLLAVRQQPRQFSGFNQIFATVAYVDRHYGSRYRVIPQPLFGAAL